MAYFSFIFDLLYLTEIIVQISQCVGIALGNFYSVIGELSHYVEGQCVVVLFGRLHLVIVSRVLDFGSLTNPAFKVLLLTLCRMVAWKHAIVKQRIRLSKVDYVYF